MTSLKMLSMTLAHRGGSVVGTLEHMLPSPEELSYFEEVSRTLNVSRAAERLGIRQPSLSLAIQRLESKVGLPLLIRDKNGVRLTRAGVKLVGQIRPLLEQWERLKSETIEDEEAVRGYYTLGCHSSVALYTLRFVLPELLQKHPGLEFKLFHDLSRNVAESIITSKVDFGIVVNPPRHPDLVIRKLFNDEVTFFRSSKRTKWNDPVSGDAVLMSEPSLLQTQELLRKMAHRQYDFRRTLHGSSLEVMTDLCVAGAGVAILPTRVALNQNAQRLEKIPGAPSFTDTICLVYRVEKQQGFGAKTIISALTRLSSA